MGRGLEPNPEPIQVKSLVFLPAAAADVEDAYLWYEQQQAGLGDEFLSSVREATLSVLENPEQYAVVHRGARRVLLKRFPYGLYYSVFQDRIVVIGCMHGRQDPKRWKSRT